ncbi:MAG: hypothetical protein ACYTAS_05280 [Planctomycetota bacterium]|jgi:hypothetical protein
MTAETGTKWLLRFIGVTTIPALIAAVMPQSWLASLVDRAEPGTSTGILITYLARILMALYAFIGVQCFIMSGDVRRYRPLILVLGLAGVLVAIVGLIVLFTTIPPEGRTRIFWIVFVDFAEGLAHTALLVILVLRVRPTGAANLPVTSA